MAAPTSLKDTRVKRFSPAGTSDSLDATDEFPGACSEIINLIPDLTTKNVWTCRPAAEDRISFATWVNPDGGGTGGKQVTVSKVIGFVVYGMCEGQSGNDQPFAYNLLTNAFLTVTIASGAVYPASVVIPTFNNSVLPTMDAIGTQVIVTHPNYPLSSTGCRGGFNISNPLAPIYGTGDLSGALTFVALGAIPSWVIQFNERAYYGVNATQPSMVASDVLSAGNVTNAGQALTFGDTEVLTAAAPLGLSNQLGGIIQSLMVFKGAGNIYQVTGDYALSTWAVNTLNVATGTFFPRSICSTPLGLAFVAPDGLRIIDQNGTVNDPIGVAGKGVNLPIVYPPISSATQESIWVCAGCDSSTIRITVFFIVSGTTTSAEYWYNIPRKIWSGPHTLFAVSYDVYQGAFLIITTYFGSVFPYIGYFSYTNSIVGSTYAEFGVPLTFSMVTASLEDSGQMAQSELAEMQVVALGSSMALSIKLIDPGTGSTFNSASPTINTAGLYPYRIDFPAISVFNRLQVSYSGNSAAGFKLGDTWLRLRTLGYITTNNG